VAPGAAGERHHSGHGVVDVAQRTRLRTVLADRDRDAVHNAADETAENFDKVNAVNLRGVWAAMKHERQQVREQGSGALRRCLRCHRGL